MSKTFFSTKVDTMMPSKQQFLLQITFVKIIFVTTNIIITIFVIASFVKTSKTVVLAASLN